MPLVSVVPRVATDKKIYQELDNEWRKLDIVKDKLPEEIRKPSGDDTFWVKLSQYQNILQEEEFKYLPQFALDLLCLPHANADCERIFSRVNNIKTKSRNKLLTHSVNGILLASEGVRYSGDCTSFKPNEVMFSKMTSSNLYKKRLSHFSSTLNKPSTSGSTPSSSAAQPHFEEEEEEDIFFDD